MTAFFELPGARWFNIPAHRPFAEDLAQGLYDALAPLGPEALADAVVLTPTRRGARALADAFIKASGGRAVLPPQMRPLGDLEAGEPPFEPGDLALDLPAAIEPLRRRFELTRLVKAHEGELNRSLDASAALELADALGGFLDSLQIEEVSADVGLDDLVTADLAEHWRISRDFLEMALTAWPRRLAELGLSDISARRVTLLRRLADQWDAHPPAHVLVAAGSTGTAPATAALLAVVAAAPRGAVVLPGLDASLADSAWNELAERGEQHPQGAMRRLLIRAGLERGAVREWPASAASDSRGRWRQRIINEALRPPDATADWLAQIKALRAQAEKEGVDPFVEGLKGLTIVAARHEEEAATAAALMLREALETPGKTAALVTPDQTLARRVAAKLARWGVAADSSAGAALSGCRAAVLASLVARAAVDPLDPVGLLAILKHPYVRLGLDTETRERERIALETHGLRGPRRTSWPALGAKLEKARAKAPAGAIDDALALAQALERLLGGLGVSETAPADAARALVETMEALARDEAGELGELWGGQGGEALSRFLAGLMSASDGLPPVTPRAFADLLARLVATETVRTGGATHARLRILGAIEARTMRADLLVVAGLEEGVWPQPPPLDPFLSRPMRKALGLPPPERRVGLAAHDFAQAACAPQVVLLHAERREGAPAVKSRWLWRLETLVAGALDADGEPLSIAGRPEVLDWARALDAAGEYRPAKRPAPVPPLAHRPRTMAVTRIETLTRDPYAVWARDILRLYPMERPDEAVDARARGTAIHAAFEQFALANPRALPPDAAAQFERLYVQALRDQGMPEESLARETALAREAAQWVAGVEAERRADGRAIHVELKGEIGFDAPGGVFKINARADRIEIDPRGFGHILDYKTGKAPSAKEVKTGFSPQLTLTAAILMAGGFTELGSPRPGDLTYLEVTGRKPAGRVEVRAAAGEEALEAAAQALEGVKTLIAQYDEPDRAYASRTAPQFLKARISDYDHLARVFEWSTSGEEGET